jgi:hypothetical protein
VQRQGRRRHLVPADAEGLGDRAGVGEHRGSGEADHLGVAGRAAGRQQHRQIGVGLDPAAVLPDPGIAGGCLRPVAGQRLAIPAEDGCRPEAPHQVGQDVGLEGRIE